MNVIVKLTETIKVSCWLPTTYIDKFRQNRVYMTKNSPLLPAPCSPAVLTQNETALPLSGGGDGGG
jgi:hypothetical protein